MARTAGTRRAKQEPEPAANWTSMLRGSVNTVVGAAGGLQLPLRAVERLTAAVENAAAALERIQRAAERLDSLDEDFLERITETLDILAAMHDNIAAMTERLERVEDDVAGIRAAVAAAPGVERRAGAKPRKHRNA